MRLSFIQFIQNFSMQIGQMPIALARKYCYLLNSLLTQRHVANAGQPQLKFRSPPLIPTACLVDRNDQKKIISLLEQVSLEKEDKNSSLCPR
jgi:hypothetical protein